MRAKETEIKNQSNQRDLREHHGTNHGKANTGAHSAHRKPYRTDVHTSILTTTLFYRRGNSHSVVKGSKVT